MLRLLITGASGFIGTNLIKQLDEFQIETFSFQNDDLGSFDFSQFDSIVHLAGIAHRMGSTDDQIYFDINHIKTLDLAKKAKQQGVKHFIFMSTVKVYGLDSSDKPITLQSKPAPSDAYGESKYLAEQDLMKLQSETFKITIFRIPVVYGPGVKGNIRRLTQLVDKFKFVPLGRINNARSMLDVHTLIQLIGSCLKSGQPGIVLASDEKPLSTTELLSKIAKELNKDLILINGNIFKLPLRLLSKRYYDRLFGSLVIEPNISSFLDEGFTMTKNEGIKAMVEWYKSEFR